MSRFEAIERLATGDRVLVDVIIPLDEANHLLILCHGAGMQVSVQDQVAIALHGWSLKIIFTPVSL